MKRFFPTPDEVSGFQYLLQSRLACLLMNLWARLNIFFRPLLPLLYLFMFAVTGAVLFSTVFANQHLPCWSDEIFMIDPAYYRVTTGVWKSRVAWDSISTVPYAPNYPLFINLLRGPISLFGVNYRVLRGLMLLLGLAPEAFLLWFFLKKGFFQSNAEMGNAPPFFLKFDIEGAERFAIREMEVFFQSTSNITVACATYHRQDDAQVLEKLFNGWGFETTLSHGTMLFLLDRLDPPYFRRVVLHAKKGER